MAILTVNIVPEILAELFKPCDHLWQVIDGLPQDAKFVSVERVSYPQDLVQMKFESDMYIFDTEIIVSLKSHYPEAWKSLNRVIRQTTQNVRGPVIKKVDKNVS